MYFYKLKNYKEVCYNVSSYNYCDIPMSLISSSVEDIKESLMYIVTSKCIDETENIISITKDVFDDKFKTINNSNNFKNKPNDLEILQEQNKSLTQQLSQVLISSKKSETMLFKQINTLNIEMNKLKKEGN